ncbi:CoA-disulfide reductase [Kocuria sp. CCUG 69068]|uniref:FAD-dependent oxidoreductase n=1 Tax=Kocuria sp. CCUG 69068 TaxID=2043138 RepID=UPI001E2ED024|nr:CoA-disulfide reductase [Kocuria sp. CCUG 69068]
MRIVIVGGVAGGMSAATRLRRLLEDAEITVYERSGHASFANCGLPYHVGGVIEERSALLLQTPQSLGARFGLDVRVGHEVVGVDRDRHVLRVRDLASGREEERGYDVLVLSPGAVPVRPPVPGIERALVLRDIEDTDAVVAAVEGARSAVVVGGGYVGLEVAEQLVHRGLQVSLVEAAPQVMAPLDPEMVEPVHTLMRERGLDLRLGTTVTEVGERTVTLDDGTELPADVVLAAVGVRPDSTLARAAGLEVGARGGIVVDEHLRTSDPDVYAVGDAVEKRDALDGSATLVALANTANLQGRLVADVIAGMDVSDRPVLGTSVVGVFGLTAAATGWNEKRLRAAGRSYRAIHTHPANHAGYYPGAEGMTLKLLVDPEDDAILGAQGVGGAGVDKRIDVLATAITGGIAAADLAELELAYSPLYGSAKDPVNMLGYIDRNHRDGLVETVQWHELDDRLASGATLLDVRTPGEHTAMPIPGGINIELDQLRDRLDEMPEGELVVHCQAGLRGYLAARVLAQHGRDVVNLDGGYLTWAARPDGAAATPSGDDEDRGSPAG